MLVVPRGCQVLVMIFSPLYSIPTTYQTAHQTGISNALSRTNEIEILKLIHRVPNTAIIMSQTSYSSHFVPLTTASSYSPDSPTSNRHSAASCQRLSIQISACIRKKKRKFISETRLLILSAAGIVGLHIFTLFVNFVLPSASSSPFPIITQLYLETEVRTAYNFQGTTFHFMSCIWCIIISKRWQFGYRIPACSALLTQYQQAPKPGSPTHRFLFQHHFILNILSLTDIYQTINILHLLSHKYQHSSVQRRRNGCTQDDHGSGHPAPVWRVCRPFPR